MEEWTTRNPGHSYINQQDNHYMMQDASAPNIMDMDTSGPPRMVASEDIQIHCFNPDTDRVIKRPISPEVQKGRISPTHARQELAKKLLNRRSIGELRQQNLTTGLSPEFHDNRAKLKRAQTTDFLNKKIVKRPDPESLLDNNIIRRGNSIGSKRWKLTDVDPSLVSRQNELAKARIGDVVKQHLETRPGPLELVQNNIMQLSEPLNNVIKSGQVPFKANSRHPSFNKYREHYSPENVYDSVQASPENALSPDSQTSDDVGSYQDEVKLNDLVRQPSIESLSGTTRTKQVSGAKSSPKVRRKNQKAKVWKFKYHEYKPPGSRDKDKSAAEKAQANETPHDIIMKQQQLLLQLQVMQKNYPNYILPKTLDLLNELKEKSGNTAPSESHLNDMKVSALKEELKKRNLHTYGNKSQLVERLRPYVDKDISSTPPSSAGNRSKDPLQRSSSEGDMLASPDSILSQPTRKGSQPFLDEKSSGLRNSLISPGGLVNSNPSSNETFDENSSIIDNLGSLMMEGEEYSPHSNISSDDPYSSRPSRHISSDQPPSYQEATNQYTATSYSQLLSEQQHEVPQPMMGQPQQPQQQQQTQQQQQQQQPGLQQQYIQQFPGQQVQGVLTTQHLSSNNQRPQFQYTQPPGNFQEMIPISQVQEMIPIPQVQPINSNNMYYNMQTQFRASNPPTAPANHQVVQISAQPQYMIIQQQQQQQQQTNNRHPHPQQQQQQALPQQYNTRGEQYAVVPPQYLNTSLQQLRQVQQPRYVQQQTHQQRLNSQYQAAPTQQQHQPAPDSLSIDNVSRDKNNSISTPDVISIILGSPNTTPMLKKGDKVGDPFNTQQPGIKEEPQYGRFNSHQNSERRMLERQVLDKQTDRQTDKQMSSADDWLSANMPQDLLTPDTSHFSKLVTPGGESVFEFSSDHNLVGSDQVLLGNHANTSQGREVTSWAVT